MDEPLDSLSEDGGSRRDSEASSDELRAITAGRGKAVVPVLRLSHSINELPPSPTLVSRDNVISLFSLLLFIMIIMWYAIISLRLYLIY